MRLKYLLSLLLPVVLFASSGEAEGGTDIVPRVINFIIFAAILYYLIAKPLKDFFSGRTIEIADKLSSIQDKLKHSKYEKENAIKGISVAKESAEDMIKTAKIEAENLTKKIEENLKNELSNLEKSHNERLEIEEKKMTKAVVKEVIDEMFKSKNTNLSSEDYLNIIKKKVA